MSSARFPGFVYLWVYFHVSIFLSLANAECSLGFNASSKGKADTEDCMFFFPPVAKRASISVLRAFCPTARMIECFLVRGGSQPRAGVPAW